MLSDITQIAIGLVCLYFGAEYLVTGCVRVAKVFRISPFIIGATVIGFGTSSPELAVSVLAALREAPELALGNVIGSNIANVGLVLGLTAFMVPLSIKEKRLKDETPPLLIATFLILGLAWDFHLGRVEGLIMAALLILYLGISLSKKEDSEVELKDEPSLFAGRTMGFQVILIVVSLVLLIFGAERLVQGAVHIAKGMGISEWFIGISLVALGTSLPEIFSSLIAAKRGHGEMAIGNVFGSNIFNILMVLGATTSIRPLNIVENIHSDLLITTGLTCLLIILIRLDNSLSKRDGLILLTCYVVYLSLKGTGVT